jgi:hypothetical protein
VYVAIAEAVACPLDGEVATESARVIWTESSAPDAAARNPSASLKKRRRMSLVKCEGVL